MVSTLAITNSDTRTWTVAGVLFLVAAVASLIGGSELVAVLLAVAGVLMFVMPRYNGRNGRSKR